MMRRPMHARLSPLALGLALAGAPAPLLAQQRGVARPVLPPPMHSHFRPPGAASQRTAPAPASGELQGAALPNAGPYAGAAAGATVLAGPQGAPPEAPLYQSGPPMLVPAPAQPLGDAALARTVRITIRAISAARAAGELEIDGRLAPIDRDLRSFADQFSFRNYRLLDVQTFDLDFRSIAQVELPGSRALTVEPLQLSPDGRVQVHLELLGQHPAHAPRMRTDYSIPRGRTMLIGGYRIDPTAPERGTLLIAITQGD